MPKEVYQVLVASNDATTSIISADDIKTGDRVYYMGTPVTVTIAFQEKNKDRVFLCEGPSGDELLYAFELDTKPFEGYPITKEMIDAGLKRGIIRIVGYDVANHLKYDKDENPVVRVGGNWFYAFGEKSESVPVAEFLRSVSHESVVDDIYTALCSIRDSISLTEYAHYYLLLKEHLPRDWDKAN